MPSEWVDSAGVKTTNAPQSEPMKSKNETKDYSRVEDRIEPVTVVSFSIHCHIIIIVLMTSESVFIEMRRHKARTQHLASRWAKESCLFIKTFHSI